jgi:hypothetical protein
VTGGSAAAEVVMLASCRLRHRAVRCAVRIYRTSLVLAVNHQIMAIAGVTFVIIAALLFVIGCLALLGITHVYLSGSDAIERDGMRRGTKAPSWVLPDSSGITRKSPSAEAMQLIVFADNSLKSFPSVVEGIRELMEAAPNLEIIILLRKPNPRALPILRHLGLENISVVTGSDVLYGRYNVRVMPFLIFVGSTGRVLASSLVNHSWQVLKLYRISTLDMTPADTHRFSDRLRGALSSRVAT